MENFIKSQKIPFCPSARPEIPNSIVFGIINGTAEEPLVIYLKEAQSVTKELMAKASPVEPTEVFRIAATCATDKCQHFDGNNCRLAQRIVAQLPPVSEQLPACAIRKYCRWFQQEGKAACLRCPQVVTDHAKASELMQQVSRVSR
jgi:hypothetical protein